MKYTIIIDVRAQDDIDEFYAYLSKYSEGTANKYVEAFYDALEQTIAQFPLLFPCFADIGDPYHAFLFSLSQRTTFWIIYTVNENTKEVHILRFWNTAREAGTHGLH